MKPLPLTKLAAVALLAAGASVALAGKDKGSYALVLPNGQTLVGKQKTTINLAPGAVLQVRGLYNEFLVDGDTFAVGDFALTAANPFAGGARARLFARRVPLHGQTLVGAVTVEMNNEQLVLTRSGGGITMKIQAKDISQGGMFQMEPSRTIDIRHVLGADYRYLVDGLNRVLLTNGKGLFVRESPEAATLAFPTKATIPGTFESVWTVTAGGRMGILVGEDATQP